MPKIYKLSQSKFDELTAELAYLNTTREKEVSDALKEARSFGDLSENSEYEEAKNEQGKLYMRIAELKEILSSYEIVADVPVNKDAVDIGSTVTLDYGDGDIEELTLVGSQESDPMNLRISDESPIGRALLGKAVGETVSFEAPSGTVSFVIKSISHKNA